MAAVFSAVGHTMVLEALLNHQRASSHEYLMKFKHCANTLALAFVKHSAAPARQGDSGKTLPSQKDEKTFVIRLASSHHKDLARLLK